MKTGPWLFGSFLLAGFECSTHLTTEGRRLDMVAATQHDAQAAEDYALCRALGIRAVREAVRWPRADVRGVLHLKDLRELARLGRTAKITQIWDLVHYGYPDDLDPFAEQFVDRLASYARAAAKIVREETQGPTYYTPINEISYYAWAGAEVGYMAPFEKGCGGELKRALVRGSIAATTAIWEVDPEAKMLNVDPLVRLHAPKSRPDLEGQVTYFNRNIVTEAFDLLSGRVEPELGGSRDHLGIIAFNYYSCNQWTVATPELPRRFLSLGDPNWVPLGDLLADLHERYGGPLVIGETGASGTERPAWIAHLGSEAQSALRRGVDLQGVCWYPILTSPDWEDPTAFLEGGIFDVSPRQDGGLDRVLSGPAADALRQVQASLDPDNLPPERVQTEQPALPERRLQVVRPLQHARSKADNFSYQTLLAGESLVVELYCFSSGAWIGPHRHETSEHVLTVISGKARVEVGERRVDLAQNDTLLVPAGLHHSIHNDNVEDLLVQQVSAPKPWDARHNGPHPASFS